MARVLARADVPNRDSVRVMERLGMSYAGEREEGGLRLVSYTLAREDWRRTGGSEAAGGRSLLRR
jgi:RimJ/RimL family protein N-acetyltransferase